MLAFNTLIPPFDNLNNRKTFITAIDRKEILTEAFLNEAVMSVIPVNPSINYNEIKDKTYRYSIDNASDITDEYEDDLRLVVGSSDLFRVKAAYLIKEQFLELDIPIEVVILNKEAFDKAYEEARSAIETLEAKNMLRNEEDRLGAVLRINAGAGGTE